MDRTSFPHYNNTKIIKFGWKLFILWVISYGLSFSGFAINFSLVGGPPKTEQSVFVWLCCDVQLFFSPCWIEHLLFVIMTPRPSNLVEKFLFYESFLMDCHSWDLPLICHRASKLWKLGKSREWQSIRNVS